MKKVNLSHFIDWKRIPDGELDGVFAELSDMGVDNIVLHPVWWQRDPRDKSFLKRMARKMKDSGLFGSACHGLWGGEFDLNCPDENRRKMTALAHADFVRESAGMGSLTYTAHLGGPSPEYSEDHLKNQIRRSIDELLPVAEETGMKIAMENMVDHNFSNEVAALAAEYDHPLLGLCFDSGHANVREGIDAALDNMGPYIFTCHLHDNDGSDDQHLPPGHGSTNWGSLVRRIKACPGLVNAETESGPCGTLARKEIWTLFQDAWTKSV